MSVLGRFFQWLVEQGARNRTLDELTRELESSRQIVAERIGGGAETPKNRAQACHVIGIERWGQRRLRVALGGPPVQDEMDEHCPPGNSSMSELRAVFEQAREETVAIARELQQRGLSPDATAPHNDMGILSLRAWLHYLDNHANRESGRIKQS